MILADTSVWIDHLRSPNPRLQARLNADEIVMHAFVLGEIALGSLRQRDAVLRLLRGLNSSEQAGDAEVLDFIALNSLQGRGIGYVDAHLLAATRLSPGMRLWTRDRRLGAVAEALGLAA